MRLPNLVLAQGPGLPVPPGDHRAFSPQCENFVLERFHCCFPSLDGVILRPASRAKLAPMHSRAPHHLSAPVMWRPAFYFYAVLLVALLLHFAYRVIRARKSETKPANYATDVLLGTAFVLVLSFSGPLVFYLKYPDGLLWFGLLLTGFIQWLYVIPAIVVAKRMGKPGFRDGALGAAVILLVLDLAGIALVAFMAQALRGLR